jgi:acyl-CoA reductase-like NAD-dependent aldehyde dehydrogenase
VYCCCAIVLLVLGGMKDSGVGRENGKDALHEYTQARSVVVRLDESKFDWFEQPNARYG